MSSVLVQPQHPGKLALPQPTLTNTQEKEKQHQKTLTQVNAVQQIIVPTAVAVSKATQPRFQTQQKILLPQPPSVSQTFSTQPFSQAQPTANQQHVLFQFIKQQDDHHRQNSAFAHDKHQLGSQPVQASKLLPASVSGQPFSAHSLSLSYPGFVTVTDPMAARVDMLKTTHLTPLSMVSLDTSQNGPKDRSQVRTVVCIYCTGYMIQWPGRWICLQKSSVVASISALPGFCRGRFQIQRHDAL